MVATSGDPSLLILPLPFLLGLWVVQGLAPAGFTLEAEGVRIERRWLSRLIPYARIRAVDREPRAIGGFGAVGLNGLFGSQGHGLALSRHHQHRRPRLSPHRGRPGDPLPEPSR
jgi:hypothetical protein